MTKVVIDAGHGGHDAGGRSLGESEKSIALRHAMAIGAELRHLGIVVTYTRTADVYPSLSARAETANALGADLFVSVHANASGNPKASGPWTIYAKGSEEGREFARAAQVAMWSVYGGNPDAVYPDASPQTGYTKAATKAIAAGKERGLSVQQALKQAGITQPYRTIHVLRETDMPAILIELGFMTNSKDLQELEDRSVTETVGRAIAWAIASELDVLPRSPEIPPATVKVAPTPRPAGPRTPPLNLERIERPTPEHVDEIARIRQLAPEAIEAGAEVAEVLIRGVLAGQDLKETALKAVADALADWLKQRAA